MVHFDAHPDLSFPTDAPADVVFRPHQLYELLDESEAGIAEFLLPLAHGDARLLIDRDGGLDGPRGQAPRLLLYL